MRDESLGSNKMNSFLINDSSVSRLVIYDELRGPPFFTFDVKTERKFGGNARLRVFLRLWRPVKMERARMSGCRRVRPSLLSSLRVSWIHGRESLSTSITYSAVVGSRRSPSCSSARAAFDQRLLSSGAALASRRFPSPTLLSRADSRRSLDRRVTFAQERQRERMTGRTDGREIASLRDRG